MKIQVNDVRDWLKSNKNELVVKKFENAKKQFLAISERKEKQGNVSATDCEESAFDYFVSLILYAQLDPLFTFSDRFCEKRVGDLLSDDKYFDSADSLAEFVCNAICSLEKDQQFYAQIRNECREPKPLNNIKPYKGIRVLMELSEDDLQAISEYKKLDKVDDSIKDIKTALEEVINQYLRDGNNELQIHPAYLVPIMAFIMLNMAKNELSLAEGSPLSSNKLYKILFTIDNNIPYYWDGLPEVADHLPYLRRQKTWKQKYNYTLDDYRRSFLYYEFFDSHSKVLSIKDAGAQKHKKAIDKIAPPMQEMANDNKVMLPSPEEIAIQSLLAEIDTEIVSSEDIKQPDYSKIFENAATEISFVNSSLANELFSITRKLQRKNETNLTKANQKRLSNDLNHLLDRILLTQQNERMYEIFQREQPWELLDKFQGIKVFRALMKSKILYNGTEVKTNYTLNLLYFDYLTSFIYIIESRLNGHNFVRDKPREDYFKNVEESESDNIKAEISKFGYNRLLYRSKLSIQLSEMGISLKPEDCDLLNSLICTSSTENFGQQVEDPLNGYIDILLARVESAREYEEHYKPIAEISFESSGVTGDR